MIWQVPFSQKVTLWILAAAFVLGSGILTVKKVWFETSEFPQIATAPDEGSVLVKQLADSIMAVRVARLHEPVNINTADLKELERLKGIGPALASNIIEYRLKNGPFQTVDELDKVSGIGPKKLEALKTHCVVE